MAQRLLDKRLGDVARGIGCIDGVFGIERRSCTTQAQGGNIFLRSGLKLIDQLCALARTKNHYPAGKRIERTGMSHLKPLYTETTAQIVAHHLDQIEGRPGEWLVERQDFALDEIVYLHASEESRLPRGS